MLKSILKASVAAGVLLVTACAEKTPDDADAVSQADVAASEQQADAAPELGSFGIDLTAMDKTVKPGDDFFMYVNGSWYDSYELPDDKTSYGAFNRLGEISQERVRSIIEDVQSTGGEPGSPEQMISDLYNSFMDTEALNAKGIDPLRPTLSMISQIDSLDDLTTAFGQADQHGYRRPFGGGVSINRKNPDAYQYSLNAGGLGLPDRDYYLDDSERMQDIRSAYVDHIVEMLAFADIDGETARAKAEGILALETKMAGHIWTRADRRNSDLTLNPMTRAELKENITGFDWDAFFEATQYPVEEMNVGAPSAVQGMVDLINSEDLSVWKDYLAYSAIRGNASNLSEDIYNTNFKFAGTKLSGQPEPQPRWKRGANLLSGMSSMGEAIGQVYVKRHFPEADKAKMNDLVKNLRLALGDRIQNLEWMTDATKEQATGKLDAFVTKIAYPDEWRSYEGLEIKAGDLLGNRRRMAAFFKADAIESLNDKTDRAEWFLAPQTVNAYYNPAFNEIVFPAAILQAPFFDPNADPAVNYGAIGVVIGHELGHGFDDQGSKFDADGIQRNWWSEEDREAFEARAQVLVEQYNQYEAVDDVFINGQVSLGENIGDVGGLAMAYHAYQLSLNGEEAPIIDGLTGDQRFFMSYAQIWKIKMREETLINQVKAGTHAPGMYRALAVRNHDAWYEAFGVQPGDALYLAPEDRVRIW